MANAKTSLRTLWGSLVPQNLPASVSSGSPLISRRELAGDGGGNQTTQSQGQKWRRWPFHLTLLSKDSTGGEGTNGFPRQ